MAFQNFIPTMWSGSTLRELEKVHVMANLVNRNYEGEILAGGDTVKIPGIGGVSTRTYAGSVTYDAATDASTELRISEQQYFGVELDDVDKVQANQPVMTSLVQEATYSLSDDADVFLAKKYSDAGITVTQAALKSSNILSTLQELRQKFSENNVGRNVPINLVLSPAIMGKIELSDIVYNTNNSATMSNGFMGTFMGFNIYETNNIQKTGNVNHCMAFTSQAITYAEQLVEMEALRSQSAFKDLVRGLHVYGAKVVRPKQLAVLNLTAAAETTI
jgi:hypothetical protein